MPKVILHAGQHKTGTTAVQNYWVRNRQALLRLGYLYPESGMGRSGNHGGLVKSIAGQPVPPRLQNAPAQLREEIDAHPGATLFLSAEYLSPHLSLTSHRSRVLSFFRELAADIMIIMYIRQEHETINSSYTQQVKSFNVGAHFRDFARKLARGAGRRYRGLAGLMHAADVQLTFVPYDERVRRNGVVRDLLSRIGVPEGEIAALGPEARANASIGPIAVAAALDTLARAKACGAELSDRQRGKLKQALSEVIAAEAPEPPFQGWDADLVDELSRALTADRDVFASAAWGKRWEEVFTARGRKPCNIFDPEAAAAPQRAQFSRMAEALWEEAQRVLANRDWAGKNPWDRSELRASLARRGRA